MTVVSNSSEALAEIEQHKRAFQLAFTSPAGEQVLEILAPFCRATRTCVVPGQTDITNVLEGRREVWLRIHDYLTLTPEQLFKKIYKLGDNDG